MAKMAISLGVFSSYLLAAKTASLIKSSSSYRFGVCSVPSWYQGNLRGVRTVTSVAASKAETDTGKRDRRGIMKPRRVSTEMQAFLGGVSEIARTQLLKEIWAYIKQHNLQDPENKKIIVCDENLQTIFAGKERVGFLEIGGLITPHFLK